MLFCHPLPPYRPPVADDIAALVVARTLPLLELADDVQFLQRGDGVLCGTPGMPVAAMISGTLAVPLSIR